MDENNKMDENNIKNRKDLIKIVRKALDKSDFCNTQQDIINLSSDNEIPFYVRLYNSMILIYFYVVLKILKKNF